MKRRNSILAFAVLIAVACGGPGKGPAAPSVRSFPAVSVPSVYSEPAERLDYALTHYWDAFFAGTGVTDSTHILGVTTDELEGSLANFIGAMDNAPLENAGKYMKALFDGIVRAQSADTASPAYVQIVQKVAHYLYDPNSPLRNEDYYLPFVRAVAECPFTPDDMRPAYRYEASGCAICQGGTIAPDFRIKSARGTVFSLHSIKAGYTMLFFSNPGCHACKGIIDEVQATEHMQNLISSGRLAVVNVYIDQDIKAWKEYEPVYPRSWHTGYDPDYVIRGERLYDVRAIPSLYLLDADKRIIFKDAPTDKVINYLAKTN